MGDSKKPGKTNPVSRQNRTSKKESTINNVVRLVLDAYVMDHWNHRVAVEFRDLGKSAQPQGNAPKDPPKGIEIYQGSDVRQGHKVVLAAPPEPIDLRSEHIIRMTSKRRGVFKRAGQSDAEAKREALPPKNPRQPSWRLPMPKTITPETIEYRPEHWPTEILKLRQGVYVTQADFDNEKLKDHGDDDDLSVSRVLVRWDQSKRRIVSCLIDGEEVETQEESGGLVHERRP
jgi:hypothetical protein